MPVRHGEKKPSDGHDRIAADRATTIGRPSQAKVPWLTEISASLADLNRLLKEMVYKSKSAKEAALDVALRSSSISPRVRSTYHNEGQLFTVRVGQALFTLNQDTKRDFSLSPSETRLF